MTNIHNNKLTHTDRHTNKHAYANSRATTPIDKQEMRQTQLEQLS